VALDIYLRKSFLLNLYNGWLKTQSFGDAILCPFASTEETA